MEGGESLSDPNGSGHFLSPPVHPVLALLGQPRRDQARGLFLRTAPAAAWKTSLLDAGSETERGSHGSVLRTPNPHYISAGMPEEEEKGGREGRERGRGGDCPGHTYGLVGPGCARTIAQGIHTVWSGQAVHAPPRSLLCYGGGGLIHMPLYRNGETHS